MLLRGKRRTAAGVCDQRMTFCMVFRRWERSSLVRSSCPASRTTGISPRGRFQPCSSTYGKLLFQPGPVRWNAGFGSVHRWTLVPRLERALTSGDPAQEVRALRQSVTAEAALYLDPDCCFSLGTLGSPE
jgi:putative copper resistance protein D